MSQFDPGPLPPAPPPLLEAPAPALEPWQQRLETVSLLLVVAMAITIVARFAGAYDQARDARAFGVGSIDLIGVVKLAGQQVGPIAAGAILIAFLLVTLGPGDQISGRGVLVLRSVTVLGLVTAGIAAFTGLAVLFDAGTVAQYLEVAPSAGRSALVRLAAGVPLLVAAAVAGYVAWFAFSTLGDVPPGPLVPDEPADDLGTAAEGDWAPPPAPLA